MRNIKFTTAVALLTISFAAHVGLAQRPAGQTKTEDTREKPRIEVSEVNDAHKRWVVNDVPYIITAAERKAFLALKTDDERENFIKTFWDSRDPDPETEENEYRQEYYERIAYTNEHFGSGTPGWKSDRGRIYITWGKPDSIESRPSGGSYDRPSYEGGGGITTYPFEIWFYRHLDGVGDGVEIEFVDPTGTGEYRIARDADEKNALATVPGAGRRNDLASEPASYQREQDSPLARASRTADLSRPPSVKFGDLDRVLTDSAVIDNNPLAFDLRIDHFRQSDDRVVTTFTIQTSNKELKFTPVGGIETATINILGRITAVSNKRSGIFEDSVTTNASREELTAAKEKFSVYQKALALAPGIYKVGVAVRDVATGNKGIVYLGFTVPRYDSQTLSSSSLVLASKLRASDERDVGQRFVIGGAKVIPNLTGAFKRGQDLGIYMEVYNAGTDQTTLRPAVDVSYVVIKDGKEIRRQTEDWSGLSDSGNRLTLARLLPTGNLPLGDYEIRIEIRDRVGGQMIENKGKFTITQ